MICKNCHAEIPDTLVTCPNCGSNTGVAQQLFRKKCGAPLSSGNDFCTSCGMVMHTVYQQVGDSSAPFLANPPPRDNVTMMTFDVLGDKAENFDLAGKEMSIWEINQMAENNKK